MPLIGMFMNLAEDDREKSMRRNAFLAGLMAELNDPSHPPVPPSLKKIEIITRHADKGALDEDYDAKAMQLFNNSPKPDIYFASCWPTMNALIYCVQICLGLTDLNTPKLI